MTTCELENKCVDLYLILFHFYFWRLISRKKVIFTLFPATAYSDIYKVWLPGVMNIYDARSVGTIYKEILIPQAAD